MATNTYSFTPELYHYLQTVSLREPAVLEKLRLETSKQELAIMQTSLEQGQLMLIDNTLWNGKVVDPNIDAPENEYTHTF